MSPGASFPLDPGTAVPQVERLKLDRMTPSAVHLRELAIAEDGLGRTIFAPVMVARGRKPGPTIGLTAAVHGNELNGIPVIHRLMKGLGAELVRGTVVAVVVVNVPGLLLRQRRFADGVDLNHQFPGLDTGTPAQQYVHAFVERVLPHLDRLIDLHTASFGRVNALYIRADLDDLVAARMAWLQRPEIIVHNPPNDRTLRGTAASMGIPAITVEVGNPHRYQPTYIKRTVSGVRAVLADHGMLRRRRPKVLPPTIVCESSGWLRTQAGGLLTVNPRVTHLVSKNDVLAELVDAFGRPKETFRAPHDGVVIGHSVDPVAPAGTRYVHLGRIAPAERFPATEEAPTTELFSPGASS